MVVRFASQICQSGLPVRFVSQVCQSELLVRVANHELVRIMSTAEAQIKEGNVRDDIEEFLSLYSEIGQYGQNQLTKYTEELNKFSKTCRQTHTQLKRLCNPEEYTNLYSHYDNLVGKKGHGSERPQPEKLS